MDIQATFEADLSVSLSKRGTTEAEKIGKHDGTLLVSKLATRIELKLSIEDTQDKMVHIRQTGHVSIESEFLEPILIEQEEAINDATLVDMTRLSMINALKNIDCDLPPLTDLCENTQDANSGGIFVESPSSFSSPAVPVPHRCSSLNGNGSKKQSSSALANDYLHVSVLRASLTEENCCYDHLHPYVILEMDHPAQRFSTSHAHRLKFNNGPSFGAHLQQQRIDFAWPESHFKFHLSREKTMELLVELWESEEHPKMPKDCQMSRCCCCEEDDNLSPAAIGHRFLGLCLVSVRDLMSTPSQSHVVALQGRPFLDDTVLNWTISLKFDYVPVATLQKSLVLASGQDKTKPPALPIETFQGVHKSLQMRQCVDSSGQAVFVNNATYCLKGTL